MSHRLTSILKFIHDYIQVNGYAPTLREIADGVWTNTVTVSRNLEKLAEAEFIKRAPGKQRAIVITSRGYEILRGLK